MACDGGDCGGRELFSFELHGISEFIRALLGLFSGSSLPPQTPSEPCKTQGFVVSSFLLMVRVGRPTPIPSGPAAMLSDEPQRNRRDGKSPFVSSYLGATIKRCCLSKKRKSSTTSRFDLPTSIFREVTVLWIR